AWARRKPRPDYEEMMAALRGRRWRGILVWHIDRLYRQPRELEDLIDLCEHGVVGFAPVTGGEYDLSAPEGQFMARMMVSVANKSSGDLSRRQLAKMVEVAQAGRPHGGRRPYGYDNDRVTVLPDEAAVIRELATRLLAGESARSVCLDLNRRDLRTPTGRAWEVTPMTRMLLSPRMAGKRSHQTRRDRVERRPGSVTPAVWEGILSEPEQVSLRAILRDPRRRRVGAPGRYLLSGLLRCHECGTNLITHPAWGRNKRTYNCPPPPRGCGKVSVVADRAEEFVRDALYARVATVKAAELDAEEQPLDIITDRLAELGRAYD